VSHGSARSALFLVAHMLVSRSDPSIAAGSSNQCHIPRLTLRASKSLETDDLPDVLLGGSSNTVGSDAGLPPTCFEALDRQKEVLEGSEALIRKVRLDFLQPRQNLRLGSK